MERDQDIRRLCDQAPKAKNPIHSRTSPDRRKQDCVGGSPQTGRAENIESIKTMRFGGPIIRKDAYAGMTRALMHIEDVNNGKIGPVIFECHGRQRYNKHLGNIRESERGKLAYGRRGNLLDQTLRIAALAKT